MVGRLRRAVRANPTIYPLLKRCQHLLGLTSADFSLTQLCGPETDLCMEGYPSSANSFLLNLLRRLRSDLHVASHTHSLANLRLAVRHGVPWILLIRKPTDAVASRVIRFGADPGRAFREWRTMYSSDLVHANRSRLVLFDHLTSDPRGTVAEIERITGIALLEGWSSGLEEDVLDHIRDWSERHGRAGQEGAPSPERDWRRERVADRLSETDEAIRAQREFKELVEPGK